MNHIAMTIASLSIAVAMKKLVQNLLSVVQVTVAGQTEQIVLGQIPLQHRHRRQHPPLFLLLESVILIVKMSPKMIATVAPVEFVKGERALLNVMGTKTGLGLIAKIIVSLTIAVMPVAVQHSRLLQHRCHRVPPITIGMSLIGVLLSLSARPIIFAVGQSFVMVVATRRICTPLIFINANRRGQLTIVNILVVQILNYIVQTRQLIVAVIAVIMGGIIIGQFRRIVYLASKPFGQWQ